MSLAERSRVDLAVRRLKVGVLQARRLARWSAAPRSWRAPQISWEPAAFPALLWRRAVPLHRPDADPVLDAGKRVNVALAAIALDGAVITPAAPLSFWRAVGRVTATRGYRAGMEVRGGCVVPSLGGGLCLLSNTLFAMAAELGWHVLERHAHTIALDPAAGLDATVLWPHVDLRFAPRAGAARITASIAGDALIVAAHAATASRLRVTVATERGDHGGRRRTRIRRVIRDGDGAVLEDGLLADDDQEVLREPLAARTCTTCDVTGCHARETA